MFLIFWSRAFDIIREVPNNNGRCTRVALNCRVENYNQVAVGGGGCRMLGQRVFSDKGQRAFAGLNGHKSRILHEPLFLPKLLPGRVVFACEFINVCQQWDPL